jgi:two-component system, NtrC family, response regulator AtoC
MKYDWPGNVRELENVIERAAILSRDEVIRMDDLALPIGTRSLIEPLLPVDPGSPRLGSAVPMTEIEKAHIDGVLKSVSWNKNIAAKILGISLKTLYTKIQQYDLTKP